jgi:hypothetical protein
MSPRELLGAAVPLAVAEQDHQLLAARSFRAGTLFIVCCLLVASAIHTNRRRKKRGGGAGRIVSFKASQYRRFWPVGPHGR